MDEKFKLDFYTSHRQFYISDSKSPDYGDKFWTDNALTDRLATAPGVLGVGTECYGHVKAELIISPKGIINDFSNYDHVVEGELRIQSGRLYILDCPNSSVEFEKTLESGHYRVRVYSSNLGTVLDDDGEDFYTIEIWKSDGKGTELLKKYSRV